MRAVEHARCTQQRFIYFNYIAILFATTLDIASVPGAGTGTGKILSVNALNGQKSGYRVDFHVQSKERYWHAVMSSHSDWWQAKRLVLDFNAINFECKKDLDMEIRWFYPVSSSHNEHGSTSSILHMNLSRHATKMLIIAIFKDLHIIVQKECS